MNKEYYLNLNTFEIKKEIPDYVAIDKDIIETIKILNQKGYVTLYCCAGHNKILYSEEVECNDMSLLEDAKKSIHKKLTYIGKDSFKYKNEIIGMQTYICFNKKYNFETPTGFYISDDPCSIRKYVDYYVGDLRKSDSILEEEIKNNNEILLDWANKLPSIRKK